MLNVASLLLLGSGSGDLVGKLPRLVAPRSASSRGDKRQQFRASSLSDVLEVCELDRLEPAPRSAPAHAGLKERKVSADSARSEAGAAARAGLLVQQQQKTIREAEDARSEDTKAPKIKRKSKSVTESPTAAELEVGQRPAKSAEELQLQSLLEELRESHRADRSTIITKLKLFYQFIEECRDRKCLSKRKSDIIKVAGMFVDTDTPAVLILLVQILLSVQVRKQNLATAYKLVFKIAREAENDESFLASNLLDLLTNSIALACPIADSEALVYGYGALKFLTMNSATREKLRQLGVLDLVLLHLKLICEAKAERRVTDETSHVLFQLTGVIRNLVNDVSVQRALVAMGGVTQISRCLKLFITDLDVVCNIARTVSVMSSDDEACAAIAEDAHFTGTAVAVLNKYPGRQDIVVRLTYCLGNLMAKCDEARTFASGDTELPASNMETILALLQSYRAREARPPTVSSLSQVMKMESEDDHGSSGNSEDVVIKIIRVIANMSINGCVGQQVAAMPEVYDNLTEILATRSITDSEELVLSSLATLNNLTYYHVDSARKEEQDTSIFRRIETFIECSNIEAQIESSRVLGNLTRSRAIRDQLSAQPTWPAIVRLLASDQRDLVYTNVGVIVNMMSDTDKRTSLKALGGVAHLISVLKDCGGPADSCDWLLASLTCQAIWNYSIDTNNLFDCMDKEEISELEAVLVEFLDEETIFGSEEELGEDQVSRYHEWEEFAKVGVNLLERLESFLEPLTMASDDMDNVSDEGDGGDLDSN